MSRANQPVAGEIESPCCGICRVDPARQRCEGCLRTLDEIGRWGMMDRAQKLAVLQACQDRQHLAGADEERPAGNRDSS